MIVCKYWFDNEITDVTENRVMSEHDFAKPASESSVFKIEKICQKTVLSAMRITILHYCAPFI